MSSPEPKFPASVHVGTWSVKPGVNGGYRGTIAVEVQIDGDTEAEARAEMKALVGHMRQTGWAPHVCTVVQLDSHAKGWYCIECERSADVR